MTRKWSRKRGNTSNSLGIAAWVSAMCLGMLVIGMVPAGCGGDGASNGPDGDAVTSGLDVAADGLGQPDTTAELDASDSSGGMDTGAGDVLAEVAVVPCERFFGTPNESSGMSSDDCKPQCTCGDTTFVPTSADEAILADLTSRVLLDPPAPLEENPYDHPEDHPLQPDKVCAMLPEGDAGEYRLDTFESWEAAEDAGWTVTHTGACGLCSSLQDLAVYLGTPDLTTPVRQCALKAMGEGGQAEAMACLEELGFSAACASIWYYNSKNTGESCLVECLTTMEDPFLDEDGNLNPCIQCDEDKSGPVFKAVSGRTRRNSGLPTALCRPCDTVSQVVHLYP